MGRYAIGLDYTGQPVSESAADEFVYGESSSLLFDSPYELNLSDPSRRDTPDESVDGDDCRSANDDVQSTTMRRLPRPTWSGFCGPTTPTRASCPIGSGTWSTRSIR